MAGSYGHGNEPLIAQSYRAVSGEFEIIRDYMICKGI